MMPARESSLAPKEFEPIERERSSMRVARAIGRRIVEGAFLPGDTLPPERTLAHGFNVTRNTVREALHYLEHLRLVSIRHGSGIRVEDYLDTASMEFAADLPSATEDGGARLLADITEARAVIGEAMIGCAVKRLDTEALPQIIEAVNAFCAEASRSRPDARRLQDLDFEIHNRLVCACGNRVLLLLHNSIRHVYRRAARLFDPLMVDPATLVGIYSELADALAKNHVRKAERIMKRYFEIGSKALLNRAE